MPQIKANHTKGPLKVQKMDERNTKDDPEMNSIRQNRVHFSDLDKILNTLLFDLGSFFRIWNKHVMVRKRRGIWQKYSWIKAQL